jgi:hypothetical protein
MAILSAALYFINHHPGLATLAMSGIGLGAAALLAIWRRQVLWCVLVIPFFLLNSISYFIAPFANALFLNAFGTRGTAVIVHKQEAGKRMNEGGKIVPIVKFLVTGGWWITGQTIFANGGYTTR